MMNRKLNERFYGIALQVGGSHYPDVGGDLLQKFGEEVVKECIKLAELKEQGHTDFDAGTSIGWYIQQHFGVKR
jgi:hypothetical protein